MILDCNLVYNYYRSLLKKRNMYYSRFKINGKAYSVIAPAKYIYLYICITEPIPTHL